MRRRIRTVLLAALAVAAGQPAVAEERWDRVELDKGMTELSLWAALDTRAGDEAWLWLSGDVGFMLSPRHEVGPSLNVQILLFDWEAEASGSCGGFYRYYIPVSSRSWAPFVGARALGYIGEPRDWDTEARVEGGFLHFVAEGAAISVTAFYARRFGLHNEWWVDEEDRDRLGMSVGLSVFF
jgi:hypothetical protein